MKKLLAYVLLVIISFQALPVKEMGKILYLGLITEEIHESDVEDGSSKLKLKKPETAFKPGMDTPSRNQHLAQIAMQAIHRAEQVVRQYIPDTVTPPPNIL